MCKNAYGKRTYAFKLIMDLKSNQFLRMHLNNWYIPIAIEILFQRQPQEATMASRGSGNKLEISIYHAPRYCKKFKTKMKKKIFLKNDYRVLLFTECSTDRFRPIRKLWFIPVVPKLLADVTYFQNYKCPV